MAVGINVEILLAGQWVIQPGDQVFNTCRTICEGILLRAKAEFLSAGLVRPLPSWLLLSQSLLLPCRSLRELLHHLRIRETTVRETRATSPRDGDRQQNDDS